MIHKYTWVPTGETFACSCGGTARGYRIDPPRSRVYINYVFVCDNPACDRAVVHEGTSRERRGRLILA